MNISGTLGRRHLRKLVASLALLTSVLSAAASHAATLPQTLAAARAEVETLAGEALLRPDRLAKFYAGRDYRPGWVSANGPLPDVQPLLDAIRASEAEGLRPIDYHYDALTTLLDALAQRVPNPIRQTQLAVLELLASDAFLALANDAYNGRANPSEFNFPTDFKSLRPDFGLELEKVLTGTNPQMLIRSLLPQSAEYQMLRAALAEERTRMGGDRAPRVSDGPALRAGESGARVVQLSARLEASGDLAAQASEENKFDAGLEAAVRRFQARHGLAADGIVGRATLAALNESAAAHINRLRVDLERLRWLPRALPARRMLVNIADFTGTLYDRDQVLLVTNAVVGETQRQTPEFSARIEYLVVNPSWDVPASIGGAELLPHAKRDPGYLTRHGYQVLAGDGRVLDPRQIDWKHWTAATLPYRFRQKPGPENALGRVKFMLPNRHDVYLHDTPSQGLFAARQRTFSHGCVRVASALELAETLLRLDGEPDPKALLAAALASGKTRELALRQPVAIYIVYLTSWVNKDGVLESRPDVYGRDPQVLSALDGSPFPSPSLASGIAGRRIAHGGRCLSEPSGV